VESTLRGRESRRLRVRRCVNHFEEYGRQGGLRKSKMEGEGYDAERTDRTLSGL
jgi:hypothetical protein